MEPLIVFLIAMGMSSDAAAIEQHVLGEIAAARVSGHIWPTCAVIAEAASVALNGADGKPTAEVRANLERWPMGRPRTVLGGLLDLALRHDYRRGDFERLEASCWRALPPRTDASVRLA